MEYLPPWASKTRGTSSPSLTNVKPSLHVIEKAFPGLRNYCILHLHIEFLGMHWYKCVCSYMIIDHFHFKMLLIYNTYLISIYSVLIERHIIVMWVRNEAHLHCKIHGTHLFILGVIYKFIGLNVNTPYEHSLVSLYFHIYIIQSGCLTETVYMDRTAFPQMLSYGTSETVQCGPRLFDADQTTDFPDIWLSIKYILKFKCTLLFKCLWSVILFKYVLKDVSCISYSLRLH